MLIILETIVIVLISPVEVFFCRLHCDNLLFFSLLKNMVATLLIVDPHGTSSTLQKNLPNNLPGVYSWMSGKGYNYVLSHNAQSEAFW